MRPVLILRIIWTAVLFCATAFAQAQLPDAPRPQAPPPAPPSDQSHSPEPAPKQEDKKQEEEKKPESKIKQTLKRGAPNCIHIGGVEKCWPAPGEEKQDEAGGDQAQAPQQPDVPQSQPLPRSSSQEGESSSKDTELPLRLPGQTGSAPAAGVQEVHPYNPHKADKDVEVGDFYFKRSNYRAAESRYAEALLYMPNHAEAMFKLAEAEAKLGKPAKARKYYQKYLKVLPQGEHAEQAKKALARLDTEAKGSPPTSPPAQSHR
jgi:tetratricopeptide (TPR) repeat protein